MLENLPLCGSQNAMAKSFKAEIVAQVAKIVRRAGLDYDGWRYVAKKVRQKSDLRPAKKPTKLPRVLTADEFRKFYQIVDRADDVQHALMLRADVLQRECGFRNCAGSRWPTLTWKPARFS